MALLLKGAPVAAAILHEAAEKVSSLKARGILPTLAVVRVGASPGDISYEKAAMNKCAAAGVAVKNVILSADIAPALFYDTLKDLSADPTVHGILMFRPLPKHLDPDTAAGLIEPEKDVDGCTDDSLAGVFSGSRHGFAPCTAEAVMQILSYYGIDPCGKRAVVLGRSITVGRPVSLLLMHKNATVTVCHTKTPDPAVLAREADILICATGKPEHVTAEYVSPGQTVIDVGVSWSEKRQKLCGDVLFEEAEPIVSAVTPVPGGVGAVTSALLVKHTVEAAERSAGIR